MVRGNMIRVMLAVAGAVMAISGCQCPDPNPPVTCAESTITFDQPTDGAMVDSPFDVSISARNADGSAFSFDSASLRAGSMSFTGTVSGNRATFTGVTAVAGALELSASIAQGSCSKTAAQTVTVRSTSCTTPVVSAVGFPQDANGDAVLNSVELPNDQLQVRVTATCVSGVQVRIKRGNTVVGPVTEFMNGAALVNVPVTGNDRYELFAELVRDGVAVNQPTGAALGTIQVSRSTPSCSVTTTGVFGPVHDESMAPGVQLTVVGTMDSMSSGALEVNGKPAVDVVPNMNGEISAQFTFTAPSATYTATLRCNDAAGNMSTATSMFSLDFDPPTVTITPPAAVVIESPLALTVTTNAEPGTLARVFVDGEEAGFGRVGVDGTVTIPVSFGADGVYVIDVTVKDLAGNESTSSVTVTVDLAGCGLLFTRPATISALLTPAQLSSGTYTFQTSSGAECAGQQARLYRSDRLADGGVGAETQVGTATLVGGAASFSPLTMNNGDFVFRGEVTNLNDAGVSAATVYVTVDLDGPAITNPIVPTGQPSALITAAQDTQPSTPGVQRTLAFSARVPMGGSVDVCITQATDGTGALQPSAECGTGYFRLRQGVTSPASGFTFPEGSYSMKIAIVGSGTTPAPASAPVSLVVDGSRPCVQGITRSLPQDTNGDGRLNIAELAGAQPQLQFSLGCGDTLATLAATNGVAVRDITSGALGAARASTTSFAGAVATVTLTGPYTTEIDLNLFVELTDVVGNKNLLAAMNDPASYTFRVDPVAPACAVTSPTQASLGIAQVPGGNLAVEIGTSADVGTNGVSATFTGQAARALTPALNTASTTYALTGDSTYTIGAVCTDASGNATTAMARTTRVDLVAPTCAITNPVANDVRSDKDISTTVTVGGVAAGQTVTVTSSVSGISSNLLTVSGTSATGVVSYPNGLQTITATVADEVGNTCTTAPIAFTVNSVSCNLSFDVTGPVVTNAQGSWLNRAGVGLPEQGATPANGAAVIKAVTSDCGAGKNVYLYPGGASTTPGGAPVQTIAGGLVTFPSTVFPEDSLYTVTIDNGAGQFTHRSFTVSFKAPTVAGIALQRSATVMTAVAVAKDAALVFGAAQGNRRVETATAAELVFGDLNGAADDAQFQLTLAGVDAANVGAFQGRLDVLEGSTALLPTVTVGAAPFAPSLPVLKLEHRLDDSTTTLVIRVTSPAGNTYTSSHVSMVDVIAPGAPTVTRNLTSARAATVELTWGAVYDDGSNAASGGLTGGSPVAGYDVRWTTELLLPTGISTSASFFNPSEVKEDGITAWTSSTTTRALSLPPINSYFVVVRARDEVSNYSAFVVPTSLSNRGREELILNPTNTASQRFGGVMTGPHLRTGPDAGSSGIGYGFGPGIGSLNADSLDDLVIASPNRAITADGGIAMPDGGLVSAGSTQTLAGAVYVHFGRSGFVGGAACVLPECQTIVPYQSQASALFGGEVSMGNVHVANSNPAARLDLIVSSVGYDGNRGRVFVYFGNTSSNSLDTTDFIEFRGQDYGSRLGSVAKVIPDINSDGINEILISARGEPVSGASVGQGMLYLYFGRSRMAWTTLASSTDSVTGRSFVPVTPTTADRVLLGPTPVDNTGSATNLFAATRGVLAPLADLTGDGVPDFVIAANKNNLNVAYLYSGASVAAASAAIPVPALRIDELDKGTTGTTNGFGTRVVGGQSILSSGSPDLIATQARPAGGSPAVVAACNVKVFSNGGPTGYGSPMSTISGSTTRLFGSWAEALDLNGDGLRDIMVGENATTSTAAWVFYQRSDRSFDAAAGSGFWQSNFVGPTVSRRGASAAYGDFDADGFVDLAIGDDMDGNGRVIVWH